MLVVHYFADGLVATDLDLSVAAIPRRRTLATRLLLGYVAWAKALDVAIVQCGNTTIADRDEFSMSFAIAGLDRQRVESGKSVSVRVDLGGRRSIKKQNKLLTQYPLS